jgi:membrane-bound metal-dependent hydrolase YbcI (DUF457 family)
MTFPTHLMAGLVIGKLTGNYSLSIAGSLFLDIDHAFSYAKNGILLKPKQLWKAVTDREDPYGDQRYFLHNFFVFLIITTIVLLLDLRIGLIFGIAYLGHLILDALDNSDYFPFFPNKKFNVRGPIRYFSIEESLVFFLLVIIFFLI